MPTVGLPELLATAAVTVLWIVIVVALVVCLGRLLFGAFRRPDPAMDTLRTRFAAGDIDEAEYERLRSVLQRH
jgi:uncharacterized membrane protein